MYKFSRGWLLTAIILLALVLIGGNFFLFRYLIKQAGGKDNLLSLFFSQKSLPASVSPPQQKKPRWQVAIVIDDLGYKIDLDKELAKISPRITLSILPHLPHSQIIAQQAARNGQEMLLHVPMEPQDANKFPLPQPGMFLLQMSSRQIRNQLRAQLKQFPSAVGINNHMGSRFTTNKAAMQAILSELKGHNLFFLDSLTSKQSLAYPTAREMGIPALRRDVFLDNQPRKEYILGQLKRLTKLARQHGRAIGIGHPHLVTLAVLAEFIPRLEKQGGELVKISQLLNEATNVDPRH